MTVSKINGVRVAAVKTSLPHDFIDIDDELDYFGGDERKLTRAKEIMGYGRRYVADMDTTVTDMAVDASKKLMAELSILPKDIGLLVFVNQNQDYLMPTDACLAHGLLGLSRECDAIQINAGCSGYVQGLLVAHTLLSASGASKCLLLAGDVFTRMLEKRNRKLAPLFGDSASATLLVRDGDGRRATFVTGADGGGWDTILLPFGGRRMPLDADTVTLSFSGRDGNSWSSTQAMMDGEAVFNFSLDVAPKLIGDTLNAAGWEKGDVSLFGIHQANGLIVQSVADAGGLPGGGILSLWSFQNTATTQRTLSRRCCATGRLNGPSARPSFVALAWDWLGPGRPWTYQISTMAGSLSMSRRRSALRGRR